MTATERPGPGDLLRHAFETINARAGHYDRVGDLETNFREAAAVASVVIGKAITPRDVALIMACVKLIRSKSDPGSIDQYVDGMNYIAFAACFAGLVPLPNIVPARETERAKRERPQLAEVQTTP